MAPSRFRFLFLALVIVFSLSGQPGPAFAASSASEVSSPTVTQVPALYVVFEKTGNLPAVPVFASEMAVAALPGTFPGAMDSSALGQALQTPDQMNTPIAVTLQNASGQSIYQTVVSAPRYLRAEFHGARFGDPVDGQWIPLETTAFAVRIPLLGGAQLLLSDSSGESLGAFAAPALQTLAESASAIQSVSAPVLSIVAAAGDPANRADLVVLGDGYTADQQAQFNADVQSTVDAFFSIDPYKAYRNFFNINSIFTASAQSGADQPPYQAGCSDSGGAGNPASCCPDSGADGEAGVYVNTAFDATYCSYYVQRLVTVNYTKVLQTAIADPNYDHILVIVNDTTYGGSGGAFAVTSMNTLAPQIAQHEFGHSFIKLADEYESPVPGWLPCSDSGAHPNCAANVTNITVRDQIKWRPWILDSTPIPTDETNPAFALTVGLFEGAFYQPTGQYRPGQNCIMRSLGQPFCQVPAQEFALTLYRGGWGTPTNGIELVEPGTASPAGSPTNLTHPSSQVFTATALKPEGGAVDISWLVDGVVVATGSPSFAYLTEAAKPGAHEIRMRVKDASGYIHPAMGGTAYQTDQVWTVNVTVPAIVVSLVGSPATPLLADGLATGTLTARATLNGNPVPGETIKFTSPIGSFSQSSVVTDAQGYAQVTMVSTTSGSAVVTASNGVSSAQFTFTFIPGPPASIVGSTDREIMGVGIGDYGNVYGKVQDAFQNGIPGITVTFTTTLGTLSSLSGVTGADGRAPVILFAPPTPGTATVLVSGLTYTDTFTVEFIVFNSRIFMPVVKK